MWVSPLGRATIQLAVELVGYGIDIAIISETHLKMKHADSCFAIDGYTLLRRDRQRRRAGGVAFYIRSHLSATVWTHPGCIDTFELLWLQVRVGQRVAMVGALYHPPKPLYHTAALLDYIESCLDAIAIQFPEAVIILAGDLNMLSEEDTVARTCLVSIVNQPTRGPNKLDRIYISEPCYERIKVVKSAVKSDHKAVIAYSGHRKVALRKEKHHLHNMRCFFNHRQHEVFQ